MDEAAWRVTVEFAGRKDAAALSRRLEDGGQIEAIGGSFHSATWTTLYVYGSTKEQIERIVGVIGLQLSELRIKPARVAIDEWLATETRWSGEPSSEGSYPVDWVSALIDSIILPF